GHTSWVSAWSPAVCSSDLPPAVPLERGAARTGRTADLRPGTVEARVTVTGHPAVPRTVEYRLDRGAADSVYPKLDRHARRLDARSEERRVGKECRTRWGRC